MKVTLLESSVGSGKRLQVLASYIINDVVVLDAGSIGFVSPVEVQRRIKHVLLSHSHIDHTASLPIFLDNVYAPGPDCVNIYGSESLLECLQTDIFNDRVWPNMIRLSDDETPFLKLHCLKNETTVAFEDLKITPVELDHIVPTFGFVIEDQDSAIALVSDTRPTERIWDIANQTANLKAVFLEASFPDSMAWLAEKAHHLTPTLFQQEAGKLNKDVPIIAIHIKPAYESEVVRTLQSLETPKLEIGVPGKTYEF